MDVINHQIHTFTRNYKSTHGRTLTRVPTLYVDKVGTFHQPAWHLKASQTVTLLRFLSANLPAYGQLPRQHLWVDAAQSLEMMYDLMGQSGADLTSKVIQDREP
eukprot:1806045-Amphidinium_carterae.1